MSLSGINGVVRMAGPGLGRLLLPALRDRGRQARAAVGAGHGGRRGGT